MAQWHTDTAMVLAAGFGQRMRPLTDNQPKPLVPFCGKALIDHVLERLAAAGVSTAVVNAHYLADQLTKHVTMRSEPPRVVMSDESDQILDTGGGVVRALPKLGTAPFLIHNSDSVWVDETKDCNLRRLISTWRESDMDCLMLLAEQKRSLGYAGAGDFVFDASGNGRLRRREANDTDALVFTGVSIAHPRLFKTAPDGPFSLNVVWDHAIAKGRVYGTTLNGTWMHIGTPDALDAAEKWIADRAAQQV